MAILLAEGVVDSIKAAIETRMVAKAAAINAFYADGITIEAPRRVYITQMQSIQDYPVVVIDNPDGEIEEYGAAYADGLYQLQIATIVIAQEPETAQRVRWRFNKAIMECIWESFQAGEYRQIPGGRAPAWRFDNRPLYTAPNNGGIAADGRLIVWFTSLETM